VLLVKFWRMASNPIMFDDDMDVDFVDQPAGPSLGQRGARFLGLLAGGGFAALGAAVALLTVPRNLVRGRSVSGLTSLVEASMEGSCTIPENWCKDSVADRLTFRDCDGDGILDPYCEGAELLRFGFLGSKDGVCKDNWPNGLCSRANEANSEMASTPEHAAPNEITIIHFNDVYNVAGVLEGDTRSGGMGRAMHRIKKERARNPDRTFVVFAGDALSPSVLSDLFEGAQMVDMLNQMKLDAASLGNHEFDFGVDTLYKRLGESEFPWLNINLEDDQGKLLTNTTQYFIKDIPWAPRWPSEGEKAKETVRFCSFGVSYDVRETMFKDVEKIKFREVMSSSKESAAYLRNEKKCDVIVPLTHQFSKEDCEMSKELGKDVDLILGGHDHSTEFTSVCGHAPYAKAASDLKTQWIMTLWLNNEGRVETVDGQLISLTDADPFDDEMHELILGWEEKGEGEMGKNMGCLETPLDARSAVIRNGETNMGVFFTDAVRKMHNVDVALVNGGTMRGDKIYDAGNLTQKTLVEMHPFGNSVAKIRATGKELKNHINLMLKCWERKCGDFVQVSGLKYEFDSTAPSDQRLVKLMTLDGEEVADDATFTVAITDYMLSNSPLKNNKLYNMVTLNDAVPLVLALVQVVQEADREGKCVVMHTDGRIVDVKGSAPSEGPKKNGSYTPGVLFVFLSACAQMLRVW